MQIHQSITQSYLFSRKYFTQEKAIEWLKSYGIVPKKIDTTLHYMHFRMVSPATLARKGYGNPHTKKLTKGVEAVLYFLHE